MADRGHPPTEQGTVIEQRGSRGGTWLCLDDEAAAAMALADPTACMRFEMQGIQVE